MNRQMLVSSIIVLTLIGAGGAVLNRGRTHKTLSPPGVTSHPLPGSIRVQVDLPEKVLDYESKWFDVDNVTLGTLPKDTSFGQRRYKAPDGFVLDLRVVLMGTDRTSMHKPQICLTGLGWHIDDLASAETKVQVDRPQSYDLPVVKLVANAVDDQNRPYRAIYVYWYVADDALSASALGLQRMWWMATKLLRTGVLQRWAYVSCLAECPPGQENATFGRMKQFIAASVPQFQLYPRPIPTTITATQ
jgi:hypothetical protein